MLSSNLASSFNGLTPTGLFGSILSKSDQKAKHNRCASPALSDVSIDGSQKGGKQPDIQTKMQAEFAKGIILPGNRDIQDRPMRERTMSLHDRNDVSDTSMTAKNLSVSVYSKGESHMTTSSFAGSNLSLD